MSGNAKVHGRTSSRMRGHDPVGAPRIAIDIASERHSRVPRTPSSAAIRGTRTLQELARIKPLQV